MGYQSFYCRYLKNWISWLLAFLFLLLFWWLFCLIALAIKLEDFSAPVFFLQDRIGKQGRVYKMIKFRTMCPGAESMGSKVYSEEGDFRITRVGRILRKTSLDELPQIFNILKGDCCLVGFRSPLTYHPWHWEEYTEEQKIMFYLKPGITGYAQVHGRKTVEWHTRIAMNVWYAKNCSFLLDCKILLLTVGSVLHPSDNVNHGATIEIPTESGISS